MPIQFPQPSRDNPLDRWLWQRGAAIPLQQRAPNLGHVGVPFTSATLSPGFPRRHNRAVNVRDLGKIFTVRGRAVVNPPESLKSPKQIQDSSTQRVYQRVLVSTRYALSGVSRDNVGVALGDCTVMVFSNVDRTLIAETTSDGSGFWSVPVVRGWPFFLVEYKAGSPDVAGTSVNTLVPAIV